MLLNDCVKEAHCCAQKPPNNPSPLLTSLSLSLSPSTSLSESTHLDRTGYCAHYASLAVAVPLCVQTGQHLLIIPRQVARLISLCGLSALSR